MKGNNIIKQLSKVLTLVVLVFAFLCSPITKLITKVGKVFADNSSSQLDDVEGANIQVEGFNNTGEVGKPVYLPRVFVAGSEYGPKTNADAGVIYEVWDSANKTKLTEEIDGDSTNGYYFTPEKSGVYTLKIYSNVDGKLSTVVEDLQINVSKSDVTMTVASSAVVKYGDDAYALPSRLALSSITDPAEGEIFAVPGPTVEGEAEGNVIVTCIPAGSTGDGSTGNPAYTMKRNEIKNAANEVVGSFYTFNEADIIAIRGAAKYGTYTFKYTYVSNGIKLGDSVIKTCEVTSDASFADDIKLEISSLVSSTELTYGEIGTWYTLPTATVVDANSGSSDAVPSILEIKVTPSTSITGATIEQDGYKFKADKLGTYMITYVATIPYTDKTVEKNFLVELKDETAPTIMFVDSYVKADIMTNESLDSEDEFVEYLKENKDATDTIKSVYVLGADGVNIDIPAIYASDNSATGEYTLTRKITYASNSQSTTFNEELNKVKQHKVTEPGVYTITFEATDGNERKAVASKTIAVVSEDILKNCASTLQGTTVADLEDVDKPSIVIGSVPRSIASNETLTFAMPTTADSIAKALSDVTGFGRLKTSTTWSSNVDLTAKLVAYNASTNAFVAEHPLKDEDITSDNKYSIDMSDAKLDAFKTAIGNTAVYFRVEYSAMTDWMTALSLAPATDRSTKIEYVDVEDTTAATIAIAEANGLFVALENDNFAAIKATLAKYGITADDVDDFVLEDNGMIKITTAGGDKYIAPFNQYSSDNKMMVKLPQLLIQDAEDMTSLSITASIADELGNSKTLVASYDSVLNGVYKVSLGEVELANAGQYTVTVKAVDKGGNISVYSYAIMVNDTTAPSDVVLDAEIAGESTITTTYYTGPFIEFPSAKVIDNTNPDSKYTVELVSYPKNARITQNIYNKGFATLTAGTYEIKYTCDDGNGNDPLVKTYTLEVKEKDYTKIEVNEDLFNANFSYDFVADTGSTTMKVVIPFGLAMNEYDSEINNTEITPVVKNKNNVTQTVTAENGNFIFKATQGKYTVEYKQGTVTKSYTLYIGDTDAPTLTWTTTPPTTLKVGDTWGKGIKDTFEIYDINKGARTEITDCTITIVNPSDESTVYDGISDYKFDKEGTYKVKITFEDEAGNKVTETKSIEVKSNDVDKTNNPTNVVGTILLIASILVVGGVVAYLILSSKKKGKKSDK
ncbi:MAG: hypothetical protein E7361_02355 [Clostridiales bacterium]|nr:hypothetical protein [Clostridiales bacterium]